MARNDWRGDAPAVAQITRYTVGGVAHTGDVLTLTVNGKTITYTLTGTDTLTSAAAGLYAAYNAATFPEALEAAASYTDPNTYFDLTSNEAGRPFTITASVTGVGATTTLTTSVIAASTGPSHVDEPKNWTLGTLPAATDDVVVYRGAAMLYGLGSFTVNSWFFRGSYTEQVGLRKQNQSGYQEYRTRKLTIDCPTVRVGSSDGAGISEGYLEGVAGSTWYVEKTGTRAVDSIPAVDIGATGNQTLIYVSGSSDVGILFEDESAARTVATVRVSGDEAKITQGRLSTITTLDFDSGTCELFGIVGTPTVASGNYNHRAGRIATKLWAYGGYIRLEYEDSTGCNVEARGTGQSAPVIDCEGNNYPRKFLASSFTGGAVFFDRNKTVTLDAGGTHTIDQTSLAASRVGPTITWNRS